VLRDAIELPQQFSVAMRAFLQAGQDLDRPLADEDSRGTFRARVRSLVHFFLPANEKFFERDHR
jgi:hypothetical protein